MAVEAVTGATPAWFVEFDEAPSKILAHHWPDVPNYGDVTKVDWSEIEPVDIITGGSPCFTAGTLIDTIDGYRPIETLREGDLVRTHRGRYMPIVQTMNRTAQDTLTVRAMGTPAFTTTEEHPFYARTKGWKWNNDRRARERVWSAPEWVEAASLTNDHFVGFQIDEPTGEGIGQELAYLIGRWLGDGWVRDSKRASQIIGKRGSRVNSRWWQVFICCAHHEADRLAGSIADAGLNAARIEERTVTKFRINSKELVETLQGFGQHAHGKRVPGWVYRLPLEEQRAIWQGWADADGSADAKGKVRVTTVSAELAHGMARIARNVFQRAVSVHKFPMPATCIIEGRTVSQRDQYQVVLPTRNREAFVEGRWVWVPVREVSPDGPAQVFNIGVRDDESYTAWGITVHNCQDLSAAGKRAGMTEGTRSNLWVNMREAIATIRPRLVVWENVLGALSAPAESESDNATTSGMEPGGGLLAAPRGGYLRALGRVLGDLTEIGYDAEWTTLRASDVGAPHHRARVFLIAWPSSTDTTGDARRLSDGESADATHPEGSGRDHGQTQNDRATDREVNAPRNHRHGATGAGERPLPNTERQGRRRWGSAAPQNPESGGAPSLPDGRNSRTNWGRYAPAVRNGEMIHAEECEAGSDTVLGESGENRNLLELDGGESVEVRAREVHGEGPGNRTVEEQESSQVGIRASRRPDTGGVDDRSSMSESQVCKPGASRTSDSGGERSAPRGCGDSLPTGASTERRKPVRGEADGAPSMRHVQETPRTDEQTPSHETNWGRYAPAVRRWERQLGRPAPDPTESNSKGNPRLAAPFAEWMMGIPEGHVTADEIGLTRAQQLKAIGNGVCVPQAATALAELLGRRTAECHASEL